MATFHGGTTFSPGARVVSPLTGSIGGNVVHNATMMNMQTRLFPSAVEYISVLLNGGARHIKKSASHEESDLRHGATKGTLS